MLKLLECWASLLVLWWSLNEDDEFSLSSSNRILFGSGSAISRPPSLICMDDDDDDVGLMTGGWSGGIGNWSTGFILEIERNLSLTIHKSVTVLITAISVMRSIRHVVEADWKLRNFCGFNSLIVPQTSNLTFLVHKISILTIEYFASEHRAHSKLAASSSWSDRMVHDRCLRDKFSNDRSTSSSVVCRSSIRGSCWAFLGTFSYARRRASS